MKILVIGLDGAAPEILFRDERLTNIRRLMNFGCYGKLEGVIPATSVPTWMCMATSQDPGSLGVYGFLNRIDYSYNNFRMASSEAIEGIAIWDQVARAGKQSIIIGVPPSYPPLKVNGIFVGYSPKPDTMDTMFTYPAGIKEELGKIEEEYPARNWDLPTGTKDDLKDDIYTMSRKQFNVVRHLLQKYEWDYFQVVEIGLDRIQHSFWQFHDPRHLLYEPGNPYENVICDYYLYLDNEIGKIFDLVDDDTAILIVSGYGAQRNDGGFYINEWLVKEGLLALDEYPREITPFNKLNVNWGKTKVWSEGGYCARVFINVKGREPRGTIDKVDYEKFRNEIKEKLEKILDGKSESLGHFVFKPGEIYKTVFNEAPDLLISLGGLYWHSLDSVGQRTVHAQEVEAGIGGCNHGQYGSFILAAPNSLLRGEVEGAHLLDISPTLLELGGYEIPSSMQGKSLMVDRTLEEGTGSNYSGDEKEAIRQRLKGLGYI